MRNAVWYTMNVAALLRLGAVPSSTWWSTALAVHESSFAQIRF
jgi:hypothetical protein